METNPKAVKELLISNCAQILACYRKNCSTPSSAGQLILPECMKLLPLYTNCLLKSDAISGGADVGCDDRAFLMSAVSSMDVVTSVAFFYPRLFPIHNLVDDEMPRYFIHYCYSLLFPHLFRSTQTFLNLWNFVLGTTSAI